MNFRTPSKRKEKLTMALTLALVQLLVLGQVSNAQRQRGSAKTKGLSADQRVAHVLSRLTFGARPGDFDRVKAMGVDAFIDEQLSSDSLDDNNLVARLRPLPTLGMATPVLIEQYTPPKPTPAPSPAPSPKTEAPPAIQAPPLDSKKPDAPAQMEKPEVKAEVKPAEEMKKQEPASKPQESPKPQPPPAKNQQRVVTELQRATLLRAIYSDRQLYEVMVNFWENHFSIFANKDADRLLLTGYDRETIRPFAMGRFRDLLGATAHSPAMLFYLDNWRSSVPRPYPATKNKPAGVDGGLNENYARELMELHTMGVDGGYTQKDVQEVARCFTGWTIQKPNEEGLFLYRPGLHDNGEKVVLGHKIPADGGIADGERVLDILATHPSTAKFIATKLARRFVTDDPPQAVIDRAAAAFQRTDGSIRETLRAIFTAPEFFSPSTYRAKVRTPFEYIAAVMRATAAETDGDAPLIVASGRMGQQIFLRITPDGYSDRADQWLSAGAMLERFNFAVAVAANKLKGTKIDFPRLLGDVDPNDPNAVATHISTLMLSGDVNTQTREAIVKLAQDASGKMSSSPPMKGVTFSDQKDGRLSAQASVYVAQMLTMVLGSPEFQRR